MPLPTYNAVTLRRSQSEPNLYQAKPQVSFGSRGHLNALSVVDTLSLEVHRVAPPDYYDVTNTPRPIVSQPRRLNAEDLTTHYGVSATVGIVCTALSSGGFGVGTILACTSGMTLPGIALGLTGGVLSLCCATGAVASCYIGHKISTETQENA